LFMMVKLYYGGSMKNAFLIVNCNDYKSTKHLVDNVIDYKSLDEIVIVDNGSEDLEKKKLASINKKKVHVIYNDNNDGYSSAINIGAKYLIKKYKKCNLIVSNSDVVIMSEDDLIKMLEVLHNDDVGLVGPQVLELGSIHRGMKDLSPMMDFWLTVPVIRNLISDNVYLYRDECYKGDETIVDVISSCFFLISSDVLEKINFMDEAVFLYYEDFILSKKIRNLGLNIVVLNDIKIKHLYSISVDGIIKNVDKYKLLKKSQFYYHTTYNNAKRLERTLLRINAHLGVFVRKLKNFFLNKESS
ncbi:MAG: glycosyltransferase family 2 protein, partial [Bacilli bacterium]|nr:glycosyltransferase family 2 protein [Bacilli bacterium]